MKGAYIQDLETSKWYVIVRRRGKLRLEERFGDSLLFGKSGVQKLPIAGDYQYSDKAGLKIVRTSRPRISQPEN